VKSIGARLRAAQLTQLAAVSLEDDPCVGYALNADPTNPDSKRFYHFLSLDGAWPTRRHPHRAGSVSKYLLCRALRAASTLQTRLLWFGWFPSVSFCVTVAAHTLVNLLESMARFHRIRGLVVVRRPHLLF
jgi:hypothetical protein